MGRRTNSSRNDRSGRGGGMRRESGGGGFSRGERNGTGRPAQGEPGDREHTGKKSGSGVSYRGSDDSFGDSGRGDSVRRPGRDSGPRFESRGSRSGQTSASNPYAGPDRVDSVRAKKALGQHFLTDLNIAKRICDSLSVCPEAQSDNLLSAPAAEGNPEVSRGAADASLLSGTAGVAIAAADSGAMNISHAAAASRQAGGPGVPSGEPCPRAVLEVGCGMGVLTQFLLKREDITLYGAEIDPESVAYLHEHFPDFTPRLIEGDFLKMNLPEMFPDGLRVIGNFPYNISSQIFFKALENRDMIPEVVGMIQREVAVRIAEPPGSREYGILSVLLQAWYDIEYLFTVSEGVFNPPPKVKSAVIRLKRNGVKALDCDEKLFVQVVKASFGQRRKMLRNALKAVFGDFGGAEHALFSTRAEQLSVADFVELTRWVAEHK